MPPERRLWFFLDIFFFSIFSVEILLQLSLFLTEYFSENPSFMHFQGRKKVTVRRRSFLLIYGSKSQTEPANYVAPPVLKPNKTASCNLIIQCNYITISSNRLGNQMRDHNKHIFSTSFIKNMLFSNATSGCFALFSFIYLSRFLLNIFSFVCDRINKQ